MNPEENQKNNPPADKPKMTLEEILSKTPASAPPKIEVPAQQENSGATENKNTIPEHEAIRSLRTYQGDVQEAMSHDRTSTTSIYLAEQNRGNNADKTLIGGEPTKPLISTEDKNKFYALLGGLLLVLGSLTIWAGYYLKSNEETVVAQQTKTILSFSKEVVTSLASTTRPSLIKTIIDNRKSFSSPINSILYINLEKSIGVIAEKESFLSLLTPSMPSALARTFSKQYMLGIYSFDTNEPFIILKTEDYPASFAGMLRWEPLILNDLGDVFSVVKSTSTTTEAVFIDKELKNKDLRILKDPEGRTILLYSFIDKNTLLITRNESIFSAILAKYFVNSNAK